MDRSDLETIVLLIKEYGVQNIPVFSKKLLKKVEESLSAYHWEDEILKKAKEKMKIMVTWPKGTEKYSNGPFF